MSLEKSVYVYAPKDPLNRNLPSSLDDDWSAFGDAWGLTYMIYFMLKQEGLDAVFTDVYPGSGIVISHSAFLNRTVPPPKSVFEVCAQFDYRRAPYSHLHIAPNQHLSKTKNLTLPERLFWPGLTIFLPHMSQIGLIPRRLENGNRFKNIGYFGLEKNLLPALKEKGFLQQIERLGLRFIHNFDPSAWCDYSDVDCVVALREENRYIYNKPAQKLYNCWLAGVIPVLGPEQGFREAGEPGRDYIEVRNSAEVILALEMLSRSVERRRALLESGSSRKGDFTPAKIMAQWAECFSSMIIPAARKWLSGPESLKSGFYCARRLRVLFQRIRYSNWS